ncbi:hypothetical protein HK101_007361 [Irineochytrium annulatum]|nr:hypothetical protein HK101_007361 [Irineochytrium annulatum]
MPVTYSSAALCPDLVTPSDPSISAVVYSRRRALEDAQEAYSERKMTALLHGPGLPSPTDVAAFVASFVCERGHPGGCPVDVLTPAVDSMMRLSHPVSKVFENAWRAEVHVALWYVESMFVLGIAAPFGNYELIVVTLMIARKMLDDHYSGLAFWSAVSGIPAATLRLAELFCLKALAYDVTIPRERFELWLVHLQVEYYYWLGNRLPSMVPQGTTVGTLEAGEGAHDDAELEAHDNQAEAFEGLAAVDETGSQDHKLDDVATEDVEHVLAGEDHDGNEQAANDGDDSRSSTSHASPEVRDDKPADVQDISTGGDQVELKVVTATYPSPVAQAASEATLVDASEPPVSPKISFKDKCRVYLAAAEARRQARREAVSAQLRKTKAALIAASKTMQATADAGHNI